MHKKNFSIVLTLFFFISIHPQTETRSFITDSLDAYIVKALSTWQIPGAAVCVVKDGKVVVLKGYGVRQAGKDEKVDENTLFMIGSNTKAFTTTALAMLEYDSLCSYDDKVQKYLPDFTMKDPWVSKELNLTDIVSHRMGMETFQGDFMYWTSDLTLDDVIEKFGKLTPTYGFRTKWGYTNAGYAIAGKIIGKISRKTWSDLLKERIFIPLNMSRTLALSDEFKTADNVAVPHTIVDNNIVAIPIPDIDNLGPAGSISSSVKDMSNWIIAQLNNGWFEGEEIIPVSVIKRTRQPASIITRITHPVNSQHYRLYALGWQLEDYEGRELIQHTGGVNGFVTSVTLMPEENLGIVVLTNTDENSFFAALKWEIMDAFLGLPYGNYSGTYYKMFNEAREKEENRITQLRDSVNLNLTTTLPVKEYAGKYIHDVYGYIDLTNDDGTLEMSFEHHSNLKGRLESLGENRFLCTYSDPIYGTRVIPFAIEDNKVKSLTLSVHPFIEFTTYEFIKE